MPRHARFVLAGVPVHLIQRGNNRSACFFAESDYAYYLHVLGRVAPRAGCDIHAYCLMTNHVHLVLTPRTPEACANLMKSLGQRYVQFVNRVYGRSGTLWEGRFRSCLIESEAYLLTCCRYVELNPVRAGMARSPFEYRWSSVHCNADGSPDPLLTPHEEYLRLGASAAGRCVAYRALLSEVIGESQLSRIRNATTGGFALGGTQFQRVIAATLGTRVTRGKAGRPSRGPIPGSSQLTIAA